VLIVVKPQVQPAAKRANSEATAKAGPAIADVDKVEHSPKWTALVEEVERLRTQAGVSDVHVGISIAVSHISWDAKETESDVRVLVLVRDARTLTQLKMVISEGQDVVLKGQLEHYRRWKKQTRRMK